MMFQLIYYYFLLLESIYCKTFLIETVPEREIKEERKSLGSDYQNNKQCSEDPPPGYFGTLDMHCCEDKPNGHPCQKFCTGKGCIIGEGAVCDFGLCKRGPGGANFGKPRPEKRRNTCIGRKEGTPCNKPCAGLRCKEEGGAKCINHFCLRGPHPNACHHSHGMTDGTPCDKKCNAEGCKRDQGAKCRQGKCKRGPFKTG